MNVPFFSDAQVQQLLTFDAVRAELEAVISDWSRGEATNLPRTRADCGAFKLSVMGGLWARRQVGATKCYTTVDGQFRFAVNLFDLAGNQLLAVLEGAQLTRLRTAAMAALAARRASAASRPVVAVIGVGIQGSAIVQAIASALACDHIHLVDPALTAQKAALLARSVPCELLVTDSVATAVRDADVVVTASRSKQPVFRGDWLKAGATVIAMGTSLPNGSELDAVTLRRAARVVVESRPQSLAEAGEIAWGRQDDCGFDDKVVDLVELERGDRAWRLDADDIVVFKSVGIGLADLAAAHLAWQRAGLAQHARG